MKKSSIISGKDIASDKSTNAGITAIYVNTIIPIDNAIAEASIEINIGFLYIKIPRTVPSSPVLKRRIIASCGLTMIRINEEENNTVMPRKILQTAAIAIGSVLNGLKIIPKAGKNTGADWSNTVNDVNIPPTLIN